MDFINDVNLVARAGRGVSAGFAKFADLLHAVVAGAVNFEHVQRAAFSDFLAARIIFVEVDFGAVGAIEAFGENSRDGGFAGAAWTAEQVGMSDPLLFNGARKGLRNMLLAYHILEALRPIFSSYDLIRHVEPGFRALASAMGACCQQRCRKLKRKIGFVN